MTDTLSPHVAVVVIGYGNTLRGDDGLGWIAAEHLAQAIRPDQARVITCHQLTVELAEALSHAPLAVLIDARVGDAPGTVTCEEIRSAPDAAPSLHHHMTPESLLACAEALYGHAPKTILVTVIGASFEYGQDLSAPVQAALPSVIRYVRSLLPDAA